MVILLAIVAGALCESTEAAPLAAFVGLWIVAAGEVVGAFVEGRRARKEMEQMKDAYGDCRNCDDRAGCDR